MTENMKRVLVEIEVPEGDHCMRMVSPRFQCRFMQYLGTEPVCTLAHLISHDPLTFTRAGVRKSDMCNALPRSQAELDAIEEDCDREMGDER